MELTEKKKNKLTNWLLAIGLGAICGLMSIGASLINNANKVSAYDYHQDTGVLEFFNEYLDVDILCNYYVDKFIEGNYSDSHTFDCYFQTLNTANEITYVTECVVTYNVDNLNYSVDFQNNDSAVYFIQDESGGLFYVDDSDGIDFSGYGFTTMPSYDGYYELLQYTYDYHQNVNQDGMQNILTYIVGLLTGGIVGLSSGIGLGTSTLVNDIFISNGALSLFGGMIIVFASVSLAIALCRWVMMFLTSLGAKK